MSVILLCVSLDLKPMTLQGYPSKQKIRGERLYVGILYHILYPHNVLCMTRNAANETSQETCQMMKLDELENPAQNTTDLAAYFALNASKVSTNILI